MLGHAVLCKAHSCLCLAAEASSSDVQHSVEDESESSDSSQGTHFVGHVCTFFGMWVVTGLYHRCLVVKSALFWSRCHHDWQEVQS